MFHFVINDKFLTQCFNTYLFVSDLIKSVNIYFETAVYLTRQTGALVFGRVFPRVLTYYID